MKVFLPDKEANEIAALVNAYTSSPDKSEKEAETMVRL